jgi:hypothetical protein
MEPRPSMTLAPDAHDGNIYFTPHPYTRLAPPLVLAGMHSRSRFGGRGWWYRRPEELQAAASWTRPVVLGMDARPGEKDASTRSLGAAARLLAELQGGGEKMTDA